MAEPPLEDTPTSWPVLESEDLFRDDWVMALRRDMIRPPDGGETFRRLVLEHPGAAVVLAVDGDGRACVLRQYRHPGQAWFIELPAGLCDVEGEDPVTTAHRELAEECGLAAGRMEPLTAFHNSAGMTDAVTHLYLALDLVEVPSEAHGPEEAHMSVYEVPLADAVGDVEAGRITDAKTVIGLLLAERWLQRADG